jgi:hypothetical protein
MEFLELIRHRGSVPNLVDLPAGVSCLADA